MCVAAGLVAGALTFAVTRRARVALPVLLDFLLAAGLLWLARDATTASLLAAAGVLVIRRLVLLRLGRPPVGPSGVPG